MEKYVPLMARLMSDIMENQPTLVANQSAFSMALEKHEERKREHADLKQEYRRLRNNISIQQKLLDELEEAVRDKVNLMEKLSVLQERCNTLAHALKESSYGKVKACNELVDALQEDGLKQNHLARRLEIEALNKRMANRNIAREVRAKKQELELLKVSTSQATLNAIRFKDLAKDRARSSQDKVNELIVQLILSGRKSVTAPEKKSTSKSKELLDADGTSEKQGQLSVQKILNRIRNANFKSDFLSGVQGSAEFETAMGPRSRKATSSKNSSNSKESKAINIKNIDFAGIKPYAAKSKNRLVQFTSRNECETVMGSTVRQATPSKNSSKSKESVAFNIKNINFAGVKLYAAKGRENPVRPATYNGKEGMLQDAVKQEEDTGGFKSFDTDVPMQSSKINGATSDEQEPEELRSKAAEKMQILQHIVINPPQIISTDKSTKPSIGTDQPNEDTRIAQDIQTQNFDDDFKKPLLTSTHDSGKVEPTNQANDDPHNQTSNAPEQLGGMLSSSATASQDQTVTDNWLFESGGIMDTNGPLLSMDSSNAENDELTENPDDDFGQQPTRKPKTNFDL